MSRPFTRIVLLLIVSAVLSLLSCGGDNEPAEQLPDESTAADTSGSESSPAVEGSETAGEQPDTVGVSQPVDAYQGPQGNWDTTMGELTMSTDADGTVTGQYPLGTIQGTIDGHTLEFTYDEGSLTGTGVFEFSDDYSSFSGVQDIAGTELLWEGNRL